VAKNPTRLFVVRACGVDVRAVGTAFNVKLTGPQLEVLVSEGTVHISQQTPLRPRPPRHPVFSFRRRRFSSPRSPPANAP
jgi:transmembrane sensor